MKIKFKKRKKKKPEPLFLFKKREKKKPPREEVVYKKIKLRDLLHEKNNMIAWGTPTVDDTEMATYTVWRSLCCRYMIGLTESKYGTDNRFTVCTTTLRRKNTGDHFFGQEGVPQFYDSFLELEMKGTGRPVRRTNLLSCLEKIRQYHKRKYGKEPIMAHAWILRNAADNKLDEIPIAKPYKSTLTAKSDGVDLGESALRESAYYDDMSYYRESWQGKLNAVLSEEEYLTASDILRLAGMRGRLSLSDCVTHLSNLCVEGYVQKIKKGKLPERKIIYGKLLVRRKKKAPKKLKLEIPKPESAPVIIFKKRKKKR